MTKLEALEALLEKVRAGGDLSYGHFAALNFDETVRGEILGLRSFMGSLDAALALKNAVVPRAWIALRQSGRYGHCDLEDDGYDFGANNYDNMAVALLDCILQALIAQERGE